MTISSARACARTTDGPRRRRAATAVGLAGALAIGSLAVLAPLGSSASAVTPPAAKAPTAIYTEDFENGTGTTAILLDDYVGAPPANATYTGDPAWVTAAGCNGIVISFSSPGMPGCGNNGQIRGLAQSIGAFAGSASPANNHTLSAYTANNPGANKVQFQTENPIALDATGRFLTFSIDIGTQNCHASHPALEFYLVDGTNEIATFASPIDGCGSANSGTVIDSFASNGSVLFSGTSVGIVMRNANGSGGGNDFSVDNIRLLDATPEISKDFAPAIVQAGQTSKLTFTVTNTTELAAKDGWSFTDTLPAGLTIASTPNVGTTCTNVSGFNPVGGANGFTVTGGLAAGQASCTVSVDVVAPNGTYANGPGQVSTVGLDGPAEAATVKYNAPPTITSGPADGGTVFIGQDAHYTYSCADSDGTVAPADCTGTVPNGSSVDTSTPGNRSYTVTATDNNGGTTTVTKTFKVVGTAGVCRGTSLALPLGLSFGVANGPLSPCVTASKNTLKVNEFIGIPVPLLPLLNNNVAAGVLLGHSQSGPGLAAADATVASTGIVIPALALNLQVTGAATSASSQLTSCTAPATLTSSSKIDSIKLNGITIPLIGSTPITIPLVVGNLYINQTVVQGNTITRRAVFLDLPGTALDVIVAESIAGATCAPAPVVL